MSPLARPLPQLPPPRRLHPRSAAIAPAAPAAPALRPVLHVVVQGPELLLWAERPGLGGATAQPRDRWDPGPSEHPRQYSGAALKAQLDATPPEPVARGGRHPSTRQLAPRAEVLRLPSAGGAPLPSPSAGGQPGLQGPFHPWTISALLVPAADADAWLRPFSVARSGLRLGPEWAPLWRAAAVVRGAVARGAVAPNIGLLANRRTAPGWRLVRARAEHRALADAARALPPCAVPAGLDPAAVLEALMHPYAGALVRAAAGANPELALLRRVPRSSQTPVRRWLASVLAPEPRAVSAVSPADPDFLSWAADPAGVDAPARLVLRLDEPAPDAPDVWPLAIFLELPAEQGVLLPASTIAAEAREALARAPSAPVGGRAEAARAASALQQALRRAAAALPALSDASGGDRDLVPLTPEQAWDLLTKRQAKLEAAGIRVLVPSWWANAPRPKAQLRLATSAGRGMFSAEHLVRFDWQVALGDQFLTPEDFERLVARRTPFVHLQTGWAVLPPGAAEALAARWRAAAPRGEVAAGAALLMALQVEADVAAAASVTPSGAEVGPASRRPADRRDALVELEVQADEQVLAQLRGLATAPQQLPEPPGFVGTLRPYQRRGLAWLATRAELGLGGILADDMGLGKTIQLLALVAHRRGNGVGRPTLIVAPTSVVANWEAEAGRFVPHCPVLTHHGGGRLRGAALRAAAERSAVVLTSYALLLRDAEELAAVSWDGVVCDEAQNIKNASAKQAVAARRMAGRYRFALTGTPVENALSDLWSIFTFVQPGYLGSAEAFRSRLGLPIERGGDERAAATLRRLITPLVLRRTKREPGVADDLPERIEQVERCALSREQASLYEAVARQLLERIEESRGMERRAAVLLALLRLKQICNHPAHYAGDGRDLAGGSGKLDRLEELLDEVVAEGDRALVFTQYATWARRLRGHLADRFGPEVPVLLLDGSTPAPQRAAAVSGFQTGQGPAVFILSLKAGGAGLNLTAARHVFHYDRWWNPAVEQQATDRAHRIGQEATVHVHKLICPGTLEERIDQLLRAKEALAEGVFGTGGEAWLTELDDRALRDVLMLRRAALQ